MTWRLTMTFAGGRAQADYMARVRGIPPEQCLVVPIDVGKHTAVSLVADHEGRVVHEPMTFPMTATGARTLMNAAGTAGRAARAGSVRFGIEAAGHYHRVLASTLHASGLDVVELNPAAVKVARSQLGQARVKTDVRDCLAMVELLVRGQGWPLHRRDDQVALQTMWVAQRRRKLDAAQALTNQVHALADLAFPGIAATFKTGFDSPTLRMLLSTLTSPRRTRRDGRRTARRPRSDTRPQDAATQSPPRDRRRAGFAASPQQPATNGAMPARTGDRRARATPQRDHLLRRAAGDDPAVHAGWRARPHPRCRCRHRVVLRRRAR